VVDGSGQSSACGDRHANRHASQRRPANDLGDPRQPGRRARLRDDPGRRPRLTSADADHPARSLPPPPGSRRRLGGRWSVPALAQALRATCKVVAERSLRHALQSCYLGPRDPEAARQREALRKPESELDFPVEPSRADGWAGHAFCPRRAASVAAHVRCLEGARIISRLAQRRTPPKPLGSRPTGRASDGGKVLTHGLEWRESPSSSSAFGWPIGRSTISASSCPS
jgi:hypothetical protein